MSSEQIEVSKIRTDGGTQSRNATNQDIVDEYAASMALNAEFPNIKAIYDGSDYWLVDGFHRVKAAKQIGRIKINATVEQGTRREAVLASVGVNATHGLRRTREDVRRAIKTLLQDDEWAKWSDREIARKVSCDHKTVGAVRAELLASSGEIPQIERTVERNGTTYQMTPGLPSYAAAKAYEAAKKTTEEKVQLTISNGIGRVFKVGDVVRGSGPRMGSYFGRIASISGEEANLELVIQRRDKTSTTMTFHRLQIFEASEQEYIFWYCNAFHDANKPVLFGWKDHYISFDAPYKLKMGKVDAIGWQPKEKWDQGLAWRIDPYFKHYWRNQGIEFVIDDNPSDLIALSVAKAGRSRSGEINEPPKPEGEQTAIVEAVLSDQKTGLDQPNETTIQPFPEWAQTSMMVYHTSGKLCEIQRGYIRDNIRMLRVEIIKPEEGYADAPLDEFTAKFKPGKKMLHFGALVELTSYQHGYTIGVRAVLSGREYSAELDRLKEISESVENGKQYRLKTNGHNVRVIGVQKDNSTAMIFDLTEERSESEYIVPIKDLEPFGVEAQNDPEPLQDEEITVIQADPKPQPIWDDTQLKALSRSVQNLFTFLELRLVPDRGDFMNDLENVYQAMHKARSEYRTLLDPVTGELKEKIKA